MIRYSSTLLLQWEAGTSPYLFLKDFIWLSSLLFHVRIIKILWFTSLKYLQNFKIEIKSQFCQIIHTRRPKVYLWGLASKPEMKLGQTYLAKMNLNLIQKLFFRKCGPWLMLEILKYQVITYHLDLKKRGDLSYSLVLLGVTLLWNVAQRVSRAPPHQALPAFLNLNGRFKKRIFYLVITFGRQGSKKLEVNRESVFSRKINE